MNYENSIDSNSVADYPKDWRDNTPVRRMQKEALEELKNEKSQRKSSRKNVNEKKESNKANNENLKYYIARQRA